MACNGHHQAQIVLRSLLQNEKGSYFVETRHSANHHSVNRKPSHRPRTVKLLRVRDCHGIHSSRSLPPNVMSISRDMGRALVTIISIDMYPRGMVRELMTEDQLEGQQQRDDAHTRARVPAPQALARGQGRTRSTHSWEPVQ